MSNYKTRYDKVSAFFNSHKKALMTLKFFYRFLIIPFIISYAYLLIKLFKLSGDGNLDNVNQLIKAILAPGTSFIVMSILRLALDAKRPYELYDIKPLIAKNKKGQSMPSRHVLSATLIAMTVLYFNQSLGIILLIFTFFVAITRVLAGVHFIKDVFMGILIGVICTIFGLWLI